MSRPITPEAILSFPTLVVPKPQAEGGKPKYSCSLVFTDPDKIKGLKKIAIEVARQKWDLKGASLVVLETQNGPMNFLKNDQFTIRMPWRDVPADIAKKGYPEGSVFLNVSSGEDHKPTVVSQIPDPENGGKPTRMDNSALSVGDIVKASLDPYPYGKSGNLGVTFGLGNIQFIRKGDASVLGASAGPAAQDEFSADPNAVASLDDLGADEEASGGDPLDDLIG